MCQRDVSLRSLNHDNGLKSMGLEPKARSP
jgi:hypothetical protein